MPKQRFTGNADAQEATRTERPGSEMKVGRIDSRLSKLIGVNGLRGFAERTGLSEGTLRNLLKGGIPKLDSLIKIADAAGVSVEWLATGRGQAPDDTSRLVEDSAAARYQKTLSELERFDAEVVSSVLHAAMNFRKQLPESPGEAAQAIMAAIRSTQEDRDKARKEALQMLEEGPPQPEN